MNFVIYFIKSFVHVLPLDFSTLVNESFVILNTWPTKQSIAPS